MNTLKTALDLFLAALSHTPPPGFTEQIARCSAVEWGQLVALATEQRVAPLLYHRLKMAGCAALLTDEVRQQLQKSYRSTSLRNLQIYHALGQVIDKLHAQQIPVLVLKGAHLAAAVYANPGLRSMADVDILVAQEQIPKVVEVLHSLGYCATSTKDAARQPSAYNHIVPMVKGNLSLEVHRGIWESHQAHPIDHAELWAQAVPVKIGDTQALGLCPEHLLFHLCVHMIYQHVLDQGVRALSDIDTLIHCYKDQLDWEKVVQCARRWHCTRGIYLALYLAKSLLATPITDEQLASLSVDPLSPQTVQTAITHLFAPRGEEGGLSKNFIQLWHAQGWTTSIQIFLRRLFLPKQNMAELYVISIDSPTIYLYYLLRLSYFFRHYWHLLIRLWRGERELSERVQRQNSVLTWLES